MKLLPEAAILSPLLEKNSQWLEALQKPHLSQAFCMTMLCLFKICHHNLHCLRNNKGLRGKKTFPTLGGNSLYSQNNHRTRIISAGKKWKNMCGSVS